jgi:phosphoesterase
MRIFVYSGGEQLKKKLILIGIAILVVLLTTWTIWGNVTVGITHYTVLSEKIPAAFNHYRISVVSDLHNAHFGKNNGNIVSLIEKQKPDMIAITGDLVDSSKTNIEIAESLIQRLVKIAPCYYVTGNHEAWIGEKYQELEKKLIDAGVIVLHDESMELAKNNETILLAGLDDPDFTDRDSSIQESILKTKLEEMNLTGEYCVLLSHRPETFSAYVSENIDLVLSGHAHGGQFRLPFIGGIVAPNQGFFPKYDAGKYSENNTTMIVSRGIGNSIIPIRFNNRPEIIVVELQSK